MEEIKLREKIKSLTKKKEAFLNKIQKDKERLLALEFEIGNYRARLNSLIGAKKVTSKAFVAYNRNRFLLSIISQFEIPIFSGEDIKEFIKKNKIKLPFMVDLEDPDDFYIKVILSLKKTGLLVVDHKKGRQAFYRIKEDYGDS